MKKNTRVSWMIQGASFRGIGKTITDEEDGHINVAVDNFGYVSEVPLGYHPVIHCAVTWLTTEAEPLG